MSKWHAVGEGIAALILRILSIFSPAYACRAFDNLVALTGGGHDLHTYPSILLAKATRTAPLALSPDQARAAFSLWAYKIDRQNFKETVEAIFLDNLNYSDNSIRDLLNNICQKFNERDLEQFFSSLNANKAILLVDQAKVSVTADTLGAILRNPHIDNGDEVIMACKAIAHAAALPLQGVPLHKEVMLECLHHLRSEQRPLALLALAQSSASMPSSQVAELIGDEMKSDLPISVRASMLAIALVRDIQHGSSICPDLMREFHQAIDDAIRADLEGRERLPPQKLCAALEVFCHAADYVQEHTTSQSPSNPPWSDESVERFVKYLNFRAPNDGRLSAQAARYLLSPYTPYPGINDYFTKHPHHVEYALDLNLINYINRTCLLLAHLHIYNDENKLPVFHLKNIKQAFERLPDQQKAVAIQITARWLWTKHHHVDQDYKMLLEKTLWPMIQTINSVTALERISRQMNAHVSLEPVYDMLSQRMNDLRRMNGPALARMVKQGHNPSPVILGVGRPDLFIPMLLNLVPNPIAKNRAVRFSMNMLRFSLIIMSLPLFWNYRLASVHRGVATRSEKVISDLIDTGQLSKKQVATLQRQGEKTNAMSLNLPIRMRRPPFQIPEKIIEIDNIAKQTGLPTPHFYALQQSNVNYTP